MKKSYLLVTFQSARSTFSYDDHAGRLIEGVMMMTEVNAVSFRQNLGKMLNQVQYRNDRIVITKDVKPVAALVDAELFSRIRRMQGRFDKLSRRIADAFAEITLDEGLAEIEAAVRETPRN